MNLHKKTEFYAVFQKDRVILNEGKDAIERSALNRITSNRRHMDTTCCQKSLMFYAMFYVFYTNIFIILITSALKLRFSAATVMTCKDFRFFVFDN